MIKKIIIWLSVFLLFYFGFSYLVLNGQLTYTTSFCSSDIQNSKQRSLFVTDDKSLLLYDTTNETLKHIVNQNDIWLEKHHNVKYLGALFSWTTEDADVYKIRMDRKGRPDSSNLVCSMTIGNDTVERAIGFPYRQAAFKRGSAVNFNISDYREQVMHPIGTLTVLVK